MKTIKDKQLLVGADFAGYPLKEAVCAHLRAKGWTITETVQDLWDQVDSLSDATAKENVYNIDADEALQFLLDTRAVTFQYKSDGKWSAGVIAQEVDALQDRLEIYYPLVRLDKRSRKYRVDYKNYIPLLIAAVQNLQQQITALKGVN